MTRYGYSSWGPTGSCREKIGRENPVTDEELELRKVRIEPFDGEREFLECRKWYENDIRNERAKLYHDCIDHPDLMERRNAIPVPASYAQYRKCVGKMMELIKDARARHN